jgi:hypothetical protein
MLDLPYPILDYLYKLTIQNCYPAYLFVEKNGCLSNWERTWLQGWKAKRVRGRFLSMKILFKRLIGTTKIFRNYPVVDRNS